MFTVRGKRGMSVPYLYSFKIITVNVGLTVLVAVVRAEPGTFSVLSFRGHPNVPVAKIFRVPSGQN
jgi:hypothetical protein